MIGDPDRFQQVAINIIQNAISNTYQNGKVSVFVNYDKMKQKIVVTVNDNGKGIKEID